MSTRPYVKPQRDKDLDALLKLAIRRRWAVGGGGNRHYKLRCPNPCRCTVIMSSTTSCHRALTNSITYLRHHTCWNGERLQ